MNAVALHVPTSRISSQLSREFPHLDTASGPNVPDFGAAPRNLHQRARQSAHIQRGDRDYRYQDASKARVLIPICAVGPIRTRATWMHSSGRMPPCSVPPLLTYVVAGFVNTLFTRRFHSKPQICAGSHLLFVCGRLIRFRGWNERQEATS
jgi:hypothetical protein